MKCDCTAPDCHQTSGAAADSGALVSDRPADEVMRGGTNREPGGEPSLSAASGHTDTAGEEVAPPSPRPSGVEPTPEPAAATAPAPRPPFTVHEELLAGALALRAQADRINETVVAANCTTWEEAVEVLHHVRLARTTAQVCEEALTKWIATAWREVGIRDPQELDGIGVVDVRRGKERKAWDHEGLGPAVIDANLEKVNGEIPDPFTVARWVLDAAAPSYWRTTVLKGLGLDPDEWCESKPGRTSVQITTHDHIGASA